MYVVLLAAGLSTRMGEMNKLLLPVDGKPLILRSAIEAMNFLRTLDTDGTLLIVTGHEADKVRAAVEPPLEEALKEFRAENRNENVQKKNLTLRFVHNPEYMKGQFTSARKGVQSIPHGEDFFIMLGDMAKIRSFHYTQVLKNADSDFDAARPVFQGVPGHPVLFKSCAESRILSAPESEKMSTALKSLKVQRINMADPAYIQDMDTPADYSALTKE